MSRENFIQSFIDFDNSYLPYPNMDEICKNSDKTIKEQLKEKNYLDEEIPDIDISLIKSIINQDIQDRNPFKYFFDFDLELLEKVFNIIAYTHRLINYYENYSKNYRTYQENKNILSNKNAIEKVINIILLTDNDVVKYQENKTEYEPNGYKVYKYLEDLRESLSNNHYTKLNIYQNLYYKLYEVLESQEYYNSYNSKYEIFTKSIIVRIVNELIKVYFSKVGNLTEDITFSTKTDLTSYITVTYYYDNATGITLTHKPTKKSKV